MNPERKLEAPTPSEGDDPRLRRVDPIEWQGISSPYIDGGYKTDTFDISWLEANDSVARASMHMTDYYVSETDEDGFHLSVWSALAMVGQLVIVHAHLVNNAKAKNHEAILSRWSMEFERPIRIVDDIRAHLKMTDTKRKRSKSKPNLVRVAHRWEYELCDGAFYGDLKAHFSFDEDA